MLTETLIPGGPASGPRGEGVYPPPAISGSTVPFVSEADEQKLFKQVVDVITDLIAGIFKGK